MEWKFYKYEGTGNDFILFDNREMLFPYSVEFVNRLCDRHFGIGADGILLLQNQADFSFRMKYYNADGSAATFCGNGGRCMAAFARLLGIAATKLDFVADDGTHHAEIIAIQGDTTTVKLWMQHAEIYQIYPDGIYLNTGTYHFVKFVPDPDKIDLLNNAPAIRHDKRFETNGVNVNYAHINESDIYMRTYEKGVENETLSCGTGVTATAIAASLNKGGTHFAVHTKGGELIVDFTRSGEDFKDVRLTGPVRMVFQGIIDI